MTNCGREQHLSMLKKVISDSLNDFPATVYLFGSWARNEEKRTSDIDIALESTEGIPNNIWVKLTESLEESTLPYQVDLVDLSKSDSEFREKVIMEGIKWNDYSKE